MRVHAAAQWWQHKQPRRAAQAPLGWLQGCGGQGKLQARRQFADSTLLWPQVTEELVWELFTQVGPVGACGV